ncbi:MAG: helix-turn-helix transcriptional regulator [Verrucomicrobiales bacterium]|nr:helix-turn-helix transcriptional regulator [Verrucomicrobiales bacterium]MCP5528324.1 helix-turn-helix transcriptional regulator [Verrucomicrobiales bacterium]
MNHSRPTRIGRTLSPREFEAVRLAASGHTDVQIADVMGVSPHTVDTYWRRIFRKLDVRSRPAAIARARGDHSIP